MRTCESRLLTPHALTAGLGDAILRSADASAVRVYSLFRRLLQGQTRKLTSEGRTYSPRFYSADKKLFFSGTVICTSEVIYGPQQSRAQTQLADPRCETQ